MAVEIVWFRRDARLYDNPAWTAGSSADEVVPLFVIDPRLFDRVSQRRRSHLLGGLHSLDRRISSLGGRLRIEFGDPVSVVPALAASLGARKVHINREVSPFGVGRDRAVADSIELETHEGTYVHPPGSVLTQKGTPFRVFNAFFNVWSDRPLPRASEPRQVRVSREVGEGLPRTGQPGLGEEEASLRFARFLDSVDRYATDRDRIDLDRTSRLSIDLKYGWLSPAAVARSVGVGTKGRAAFVRQLAWRDFYGHLLTVAPDTVNTSFRPEYRHICWEDDQEGLEAWKEGSTGYPIVDAGMRQLRAEGWMHNRVRMITASFLVKDLLIDWRLGERWFRRQLLDADVAQNVGNWQWVAGTGTDAAPYFRVFNPVAQSRRFDPQGEYLRRWVPELAALSDEDIHSPWEMSADALSHRGVELGVSYPSPIVEHSMARMRAVEAYRTAWRPPA